MAGNQENGKVVLWSGYPRVVGVNWPPVSNEASKTEKPATSPVKVETSTSQPPGGHDLRGGGVTRTVQSR